MARIVKKIASPAEPVKKVTKGKVTKGKVTRSRKGKERNTEVDSCDEGDYIRWDDDIAGTDNMTSDDRLIEFLLLNDGANLNILTPTAKHASKDRRGMSIRHLARQCHDYFEQKGVTYRKFDSIRTHMIRLHKDYRTAGAMFKQTGNGSQGLTNSTGAEEFKGKFHN